MTWSGQRVPEPLFSPPRNGCISDPPPKPLKHPRPVPQEMRSVLRKAGSPRKVRRARLNPLVLLLDAALTGELEVVQQAVKEVSAAGAGEQGWRAGSGPTRE